MKIDELFSVRGKVALVTGGSRGIGEMIVRGYVENGAKTYITARNAEACDALARELSRIGECVSSGWPKLWKRASNVSTFWSTTREPHGARSSTSFRNRAGTKS